MRLRSACGFGAGLVLAIAFGLGAAQGQEAGAAQPTVPILTLDQDALFTRSLYGQALRAQLEAEASALEAESRRIDAELSAEELALTQKRKEMSAQDFAPLAAAFDQKAQRLRAENAAAIEALRAKEQAGRREFFATASEILGDFMVERGAAAIIDKGAVIVSLRGLDVTDAVIARIDAVLGDGAQK